MRRAAGGTMSCFTVAATQLPIHAYWCIHAPLFFVLGSQMRTPSCPVQ